VLKSISGLHKVAVVLWVISTCISQWSMAQGKDGALLHAVDNEVIELMDDGDIPGVSLVMVIGDREIIRNYGYADLDRKVPVTPGTLFQLGSCSKAFTALAMLKLVASDSVDLQGSVSRYIPWFHVKYKDSLVDISVQQLLHHTSGIPWQTISTIPPGNDNDMLEKTVRNLVGINLRHQPGKKYEYATINYDVIALIIETVTRRKFEDYIRETVFVPLDLTYTTIGIPSYPAAMATGYKIGFFKPREYLAPTFRGNNAAGYVISNAKDMVKWLKFQMLMTDHSLSTLAAVSHRRDETVALHGMSAYAMGWEVSLNGNQEIFHGGVNPNFTTHVAVRPSAGIGVAVLANSNSTYTPLIANRVMALYTADQEALRRQTDPGDENDSVYSMLSMLVVIYIGIVFCLLGYMTVEVLKGKRLYARKSNLNIWRFAGPIATVLPFLAGLYLVPQAMAGFTWQSIVIWTPSSFVMVTHLILWALLVSYIAHVVAVLFPQNSGFRNVAPKLVLMSILSGVSNLVIIIMIMSALDHDRIVALKYLVFYYVLIISVYLLGRKFVQTSLIRLTSGLVYELRMKLIDNIFMTSYQKFEKIDRGRVYTALNDDVSTIGDSINTFVMLITSIITAIGAFIYLGTIAFWATILTLILVASIATVYYSVSRSTRKYYEQARDARSFFMRLINNMIDGFKEISLRDYKKLTYKADVETSAREYRNKISRADIRFVNAFLVGESLLVLLLGGVSFGIPEIFPDIKFYTVVSFVIVLLYLIGPINGILGAVPAIMRLRVAWSRIQQFIGEIPADRSSEVILAPLYNAVQNMKAVGLKFRYKNVEDGEVFEIGPIDLEVNSGEIVFIIGGNGSGKTTLSKLLTGLYAPDDGMVMINDTVVSGQQLGMFYSAVFSPPHIFEKLYVETSYTPELLDKYLKLLNLSEKVSVSDGRYSTIDLSGGQRKRLALLQCYLEDAPIYLFDEWAADQDPGFRNFFYRTLLPEMRRLGKIVIAITHDDHYFDVADKVFRMKNGKCELCDGNYSFITSSATSVF